jgi:hypothetical protein
MHGIRSSVDVLANAADSRFSTRSISTDVLIEVLVGLLRIVVDANDQGWQARGEAELDLGEAFPSTVTPDQGIQLTLRLQHAPMHR